MRRPCWKGSSSLASRVGAPHQFWGLWRLSPIRRSCVCVWGGNLLWLPGARLEDPTQQAQRVTVSIAGAGDHKRLGRWFFLSPAHVD